LDKRDQRKYAVKVYEKYKLTDPMKKKAAQREITVLKRLEHPGIIQLHDLIDTPKQIYIVTDYIKGISLQQYSKSVPNRVIRETTARRIFKQVAEGVAYLHSNNIVHRDLKLDNILVEESTRMVKLIDFGFSVVVGGGAKLKVFCGTPSYMAPEIVRKHEYDGKPVDIWALGVLLFVLLTGTFPFRGVSE
jgi:serine/threonine protein kinase